MALVLGMRGARDEKEGRAARRGEWGRARQRGHPLRLVFGAREGRGEVGGKGGPLRLVFGTREGVEMRE